MKDLFSIPIGDDAKDAIHEQLMKKLSQIETYEDQQTFLRELRKAMLATMTEVDSISDEMADKRVYELERAIIGKALDSFSNPEAKQEDAERQLVYSTADVMRLTGIKNKNTLLKKLRNGEIQGRQDSSGRWIVSRNALAEYLGTNDF